MSHTPVHVAIIPDANRRWAKSQGLAIWKGHEKGVERAEEVMRASFDFGVEYFTFWAASVSNLEKRAKIEVRALVRLLTSYVKKFLDSKELEEKGIRFRLLGRGLKIVKDQKLTDLVRALEKQTEKGEKNFITLLFGYDGQEEMLEAAKKIKKEKTPVNAQSLKKALWTGFLPPVDLAIRTGGEPHWSAGFMMWHTANSQFYFTETFWPDFGKDDLKKAIDEYARRERRMGK